MKAIITVLLCVDADTELAVLAKWRQSPTTGNVRSASLSTLALEVYDNTCMLLLYNIHCDP